MDLRAQTDNAGGAGGSTPEIVEKAASTVQSVLDTTDQAADQAAQKVKDVTQRLRTGQQHMVDAVHHATEAAGDYRDRALSMTQKPEEWMREASDYIRAQPFKSVAIAFAAGWIYGRFFR